MTYEYLQAMSEIVASALFLSVLAGVAVYVFRPSNTSRFERAARLPLDNSVSHHQK
jgi:cbb3-type cytochrome oxidase subunit 3